MLPKKHKLSGYYTSLILKTGQKIDYVWFDVFWQKSNRGCFQASVVVAKKLKLNTVKKNYLKRIIYGALRRYINKKKDLSTVYFIKKKLPLTMNYESLVKEIGKSIKQTETNI